MDITGIVQSWMDNPGSNDGLVLFMPPSSSYRSVYSVDYSGGSHAPFIAVTYDLPSYQASYGPIGEFEGEPVEARLPQPGATNSDHDGLFPILLQNQGWMDWNSGQSPAQANPTASQTVRLSYHVDPVGDPDAGTNVAGWEIWDGRRTHLDANASLMNQYWNWYTTGNGTEPAANPHVLAGAVIRNSDYTTPGVRNVFFDLVHEGLTWFSGQGVAMSDPEPIRWTDPPTILAPTSGAVFSPHEDITVEWERPHDGAAGAWTPSEYRLKFYNGVEVHEATVPGTTNSYTVPAGVNLGVGTVTWAIEARDGYNESAGDPQKWTHERVSAFAVEAADLGNGPLTEQFGGVNPHTGNFYTAITDMSIASVAGGLEVTRHFNSQSLEAGMFGPGIVSIFDRTFNCASGNACNSAGGDRILRRADGSQLRFVNDGQGNYTPIDDSEVVGTRIVTGSTITYELEYPDGSIQRFRSPTANSDLWGDYAGSESPEGHVLTVNPLGNSRFPQSVTDVESDRTIHFVYESFFPHGPSDRRVSRIYSGTPGTSAYEEVNYVYNGSWELSSATNANNSTWVTTWTAGGQIDQLQWPANGRLVDLGYHSNGAVSTVVNGEGDTISFTYNFATSTTTINDGRSLTWTVEADPQNRTAVLTPPGGAGYATTYSYLDSNGEISSFRTGVTDANGNSASLIYGDDENDAYEFGNLLERTNAAGETTYYRYESANYASADHISGPSHVCDARSADASDSTYCTIFTYDQYGNKISEREPGETIAEAETWEYTDGTETAVGDGTMPAGLLETHSTGHVAADETPNLTEYRYDAQGDLRWMRDPNGLITEYTHDALGRVLTETITYTDDTATVSTVAATYTYDDAGRLVTTTGPVVANPVTGEQHQYKVTYTVDGNGQVDKKVEEDLLGTDPDRVWDYEQDALDRIITTWDPRSHVTGTPMRYEYDGNGNQTAVVDYEGNRVETTYDVRNNPDITTAIGFDDGHGTIADRVLGDQDHDDAGRLTSLRTYTGVGEWFTETYGYDDADRKINVTRSDDGTATTIASWNYVDGYLQSSQTGDVNAAQGEDLATTSYTYFANGRVETETVNSDRTTAYTYDPAGNVLTLTTSGTDQLTNTQTTQLVTNSYDAGSNVTQTSVENGAVDLLTSSVYDERGLLIETTDPNGNTLTSRYDALGRLIETAAPAVAWEAAGAATSIDANWATGTASPITAFGYNTYGDPTHVEDANGNVTETSYDTNGRRIRVDHPAATQPDGSTLTGVHEEWGYDANGNTTTYQSRNGHTTSYAFDSANRAVTQTDPVIDNPAGVPYPAGVAETFYDFAGRAIGVEGPTGATTTMSYNERGWLESTSTQVREITGIQPAMTSTVTNTYSGQGFLTSTTDSEGVVTTSTFNAWGQVLTTTLGTGLDALDPTVHVYDGVGRLRQTTAPSGEATRTDYDLAGRATTITDLDDTGATIRTVTQGFDANGNPETVTTGRGGTTTSIYDDLGRITSIVQDVDGTDTITYTYGYDLVGNLTSVTDGNNNTTRYVYNEWNLQTHLLEPTATASLVETETDRLYTVAYDAGGQAVTETSPGGAVVNRVYNALGLPVSETSAKPATTTVGKTWGYDLAGRPVQLSHPDGPIVLTYDDRGLLVEQSGGAGASSTVYDTAGRPVTQTDDAGTRTYTYDPVTGLVELIADGTATNSGTGRVSGSVAEYVFAGGSGTTIADSSGYGTPLDLTIANPSATSWSPDGLNISGTTEIESNSAATKVVDAIAASGEFTLEAWVDPANLTQTGPARIVTISQHTGSRNATLGQAGDEIDLRSRATGTSTNGLPSLRTTGDNMSTGLAHIVATHDATGTREIWVDGNLVATDTAAGTINNWDNTVSLLIGSEQGGSRQWRGDICLAAVYDTALTSSQIDQNHQAGCPTNSGGSGNGTGAWSQSYDYDTAGRTTTIAFDDGGERSFTYDTAGRLATDTITDAANNTTGSTAYHYSCDHELIGKDIDLPGNTGSGLHTYTYDHAGRLTSWNDSATELLDPCPTNNSGGGSSGNGRVTGSVAEYHLAGGSGTTITDTVGDLDLNIADPSSTTWGPNGLTFDTATGAVSSTPATAVYNDVTASGEITMEAWVTPANTTQGGPARILSVSSNVSLRNATLGQNGSGYDWRVRATNTSNNGTPSLATLTGLADTQTQHLVATFDSNGTRRFYLDGVLEEAVTGAGTIDGWDSTMRILIGNEATGDRPWLGEVCLAAVYDTALTQTQITQNHNAGCPTSGGSGGSGTEWTPSGEIYTYDDAGNRLTAGTNTFTYDNRNRLLTDPDGTYTWHTDGTLDAYTPNSGPVEDYTYDAAGRLTDITDGTASTDYTYDALDRIAERNQTPFTYAGGSLDPTSDGTDTYHRTATGRLLAVGTSAGTYSAAANNHHDLTGLINGDGTLAHTATYTPYGEPDDTTGIAVNVGYQSDYTDPTTDHVWMGARWYQPSTATFLTRDTYAGELTTPFTLNRYTYATNNPIAYWDPNGRTADALERRQQQCVAQGGSPEHCHEQAEIHHRGSRPPSVPRNGREAAGKGIGGGRPKPPPPTVPDPSTAIEETIAAWLENSNITDPEQIAGSLDVLAELVDDLVTIGDFGHYCDDFVGQQASDLSSFGQSAQRRCETAKTLIDIAADAGWIIPDPHAANDLILIDGDCTDGVCHMFSPVSDLVVPDNSYDQWGEAVGMGVLEYASSLNLLRLVPPTGRGSHNLSWQNNSRINERGAVGGGGIRHQMREVGLPGWQSRTGPFRFRAPTRWSRSGASLPRTGAVDRFGNVWQRGPAHGRAGAAGFEFEWDVQLSQQGLNAWGEHAHRRSDGGWYINVTPDGRLSH